jgi:hypothetical protein
MKPSESLRKKHKKERVIAVTMVNEAKLFTNAT